MLFQLSIVKRDFPVVLKRPKLWASVMNMEEPIKRRINPTPGSSIRI
jgi:hypothetical protein